MTDTNLVDALRALEPYLDAIVCYASSMDEHEPNRLAFNARQALAAHDAQPSPTDAGLEAMARAICDTEWGGTQKWERWPGRFKARYHELALAAYSALQSVRDK